jgi:hypothetical protein
VYDLERGVLRRRSVWSRALRAPVLVIPGYTSVVKTAISVPDETFQKASRRAKELGVSRSEFFSRAAARYLDELDAASVTDQINQAVDAQNHPDDASVAALAQGRRVLDDSSDSW